MREQRRMVLEKRLQDRSYSGSREALPIVAGNEEGRLVGGGCHPALDEE